MLHVCGVNDTSEFRPVARSIEPSVWTRLLFSIMKSLHPDVFNGALSTELCYKTPEIVIDGQIVEQLLTFWCLGNTIASIREVDMDNKK